MNRINYEEKNFSDSIKELERNNYVWVHSKEVVARIEKLYDVIVSMDTKGIYCITKNIKEATHE